MNGTPTAAATTTWINPRWTLPQAIAWVRTRDWHHSRQWSWLDIKASLAPFAEAGPPDRPTIREAWALLHQALEEGTITATDPSDQPIPARFWDAKGRIAYVFDIYARVQRDDVIGLLNGATPSQTDTTPATGPDAPVPPPKRRALGGRPTKWDWEAFAAEIIRHADLNSLPITPDGLPDRAAINKIMVEWCSREWGDEPANSMIRDKIAKLCPDPK